jgi:tetratricopeptide (TPR) repeat protein
VSDPIQELEALARAGRWSEAGARCTELCRRTPGDPRLWFMAARVERQRGQMHQALSHYRKAAELAPQSGAVLLEYGVALQAAGEMRQAISLLEPLTQREPGNWLAHQALGGAYCQASLFKEARQCFEQALQLNPEAVDALLGLCTVWDALQRPDQVAACLRKAIALRPQAAALHFNLALALENMGQLDEAYQACNQTLALSPGDNPAIALQADICRRQGRYEAGLALLDPLLQRGVKHPRIVDAFVNLCHKADRCEEALNLANEVCSTPGLSEQERACLLFSTGHTLDRLGRYAEAFEHFRIANDTRKAGNDVSALRQLVDDIIAVHTTDPASQWTGRAHGTRRLIFIVGMPRSGTTLVEQVLASHPDVYGAGELTVMPEVQHAFASLTGTGTDYPRGFAELNAARVESLRQAYLSRLPEAARWSEAITDKQPGNFLAVGLIRALFPEAAIIHCTRDARDTCLSCYFNNFTGLPYTYDLTALGRTWRQYARLMQHWQALSIPMLDLRYESLVDDTERVSRSLLEYCGLTWDDACLEFHHNKRVVTTVSHDQVTQPIYSSSIGRWKHYEEHLEPLLDALEG